MFKRATAVVAVFIAALSMAFGFGATAAQATITSYQVYGGEGFCEGGWYQFYANFGYDSTNGKRRATQGIVLKESGSNLTFIETKAQWSGAEATDGYTHYIPAASSVSDTVSNGGWGSRTTVNAHILIWPSTGGLCDFTVGS